MKVAKRVIAGIGLLVLAVLLVAFILPRHPTVSRSIDIAAPPAAVYPLVGDLRRFNEWSPWFGGDPRAEYTFTGPVDGVGQTMNWVSADPALGSGSQTITAIDPGKSVQVALDLGEEGTADTIVAVAPKGAGSTVTWSFSVDAGFNPVMRYMGLALEKWVAPDFEKGLAKLKTVAEAPAKAG